MNKKLWLALASLAMLTSMPLLADQRDLEAVVVPDVDAYGVVDIAGIRNSPFVLALPKQQKDATAINPVDDFLKGTGLKNEDVEKVLFSVSLKRMNPEKPVSEEIDLVVAISLAKPFSYEKLRQKITELSKEDKTSVIVPMDFGRLPGFWLCEGEKGKPNGKPNSGIYLTQSWDGKVLFITLSKSTMQSLANRCVMGKEQPIALPADLATQLQPLQSAQVKLAVLLSSDLRDKLGKLSLNKDALAEPNAVAEPAGAAPDAAPGADGGPDAASGGGGPDGGPRRPGGPSATGGGDAGGPGGGGPDGGPRRPGGPSAMGGGDAGGPGGGGPDGGPRRPGGPSAMGGGAGAGPGPGAGAGPARPMRPGGKGGFPGKAAMGGGAGPGAGPGGGVDQGGMAPLPRPAGMGGGGVDQGGMAPLPRPAGMGGGGVDQGGMAPLPRPAGMDGGTAPGGGPDGGPGANPQPVVQEPTSFEQSMAPYKETKQAILGLLFKQSMSLRIIIGFNDQANAALAKQQLQGSISQLQAMMAAMAGETPEGKVATDIVKGIQVKNPTAGMMQVDLVVTSKQVEVLQSTVSSALTSGLTMARDKAKASNAKSKAAEGDSKVEPPPPGGAQPAPAKPNYPFEAKPGATPPPPAINSPNKPAVGAKPATAPEIGLGKPRPGAPAPQR